LEPSGRLLHVVVLAVGWQLWQAFAALIVPDGQIVPPTAISHSFPHFPLTQISPAPQFVPSATLLHVEVLAVGRQAWQTFAGLIAPDA
jgi:hypothetical protein